MTTQTYGVEAALLQLTPRQLPNAVRSSGRVRRISNTYVLNADVSGSTITLLPLPIGHLFAFGVLNGPTLGSSTLQIGDVFRLDAAF